MPQERGSVPYAVAGEQHIPGVRMNVRSNVYVPGGDVGAREAFYAGTDTPPRRRGAPTVRKSFAIVFLAAIACVMLALVTSALTQRARLSAEITGLYADIAATNDESVRLSNKVVEARDSMRICILAVQRFGMVSEEGVPTHYLHASSAPYDGSDRVFGSHADNSPIDGVQSAGLTH